MCWGDLLWGAGLVPNYRYQTQLTICDLDTFRRICFFLKWASCESHITYVFSFSAPFRHVSRNILSDEWLSCFICFSILFPHRVPFAAKLACKFKTSYSDPLLLWRPSHILQDPFDDHTVLLCCSLLFLFHHISIVYSYCFPLLPLDSTFLVIVFAMTSSKEA